MELTALSWAEVAGALAATSALLVALYLVRLRRRVVEVPFIALFRDALPEERTTRFFARLKNVASLLLMLVIAALVALAMGLPRWSVAASEAHAWVWVVDTSASMQAIDDGASERTRFETARTALLARIATLGPNERALVLAAGPRTEVVHPWTRDRASLRTAVERLSATDAPLDAASSARGPESLGWARELCAASDASACSVEVWTDGGLVAGAPSSEGGDAPRVHRVGPRLPAANLAITALAARRFPSDPTRAEVLVSITSNADTALDAALELAVDGALTHRETITVPAHGTLERTLDDVTGVDALVEARLRPPATSPPAASPPATSPFAASPADARSSDAAPRLDALPLDDTAVARLAPRRRRRVLLVGPSHAYLDAALLLDPYLDVNTVSADAYEAGLASGALPGDRELVVFDGYTPASPPTRPFLLLDPGTPARDWLPVGEPIARPLFETERRTDRMLRFVALHDVNIGSARPLVPQPGDDVLGGEARGALLVRGHRGDVPFVALAFDVRASDLPLRIAWPILLLETFAALAPDDLALAESARTGRPFSRALPAALATGDDAPSLCLRGATDGADACIAGSLDEGRVTFVLDRRGIYDWRRGATELASDPVVANLFDVAESRLEAADEGALTDDEPPLGEAPPRITRDDDATPIFIALVGLALALLAIEWLTFHRRWTA